MTLALVTNLMIRFLALGNLQRSQGPQLAITACAAYRIRLVSSSEDHPVLS